MARRARGKNQHLKHRGRNRPPGRSATGAKLLDMQPACNAQAADVSCPICWCCPASLGFSWLRSASLGFARIFCVLDARGQSWTTRRTTDSKMFRLAMLSSTLYLQTAATNEKITVAQAAAAGSALCFDPLRTARFDSPTGYCCFPFQTQLDEGLQLRPGDVDR